MVEIEKLKKRLFDGGLVLDQLKNLSVQFVYGNHVLRRDLEKLPLETFSSILILAEEEYENTMDEADSRTLTCLLLIRDIIAKRLSLGTVGPGNVNLMQMGDAVAPRELSGEPLGFSRRLGLKRGAVSTLTHRPKGDFLLNSAQHGGTFREFSII